MACVMLINDERTTNGHTFWSPIFSLFGLLKTALVDSRFRSLIFSCKAANNPNNENSMNGISLLANLKKNAPMIGPNIVPKTKPDSRFAKIVVLFLLEEILPAYPNRAGLVAEPNIP